MKTYLIERVFVNDRPIRIEEYSDRVNQVHATNWHTAFARAAKQIYSLLGNKGTFGKRNAKEISFKLRKL